MSAEDVGPMGRLAAAYGVRRELVTVSKAIRKRLSFGWLGQRGVVQVVGLLVQDPSNIERVKEGRPLPEEFREAMEGMVARYAGSMSPETFVDVVLADIAAALRDLG